MTTKAQQNKTADRFIARGNQGFLKLSDNSLAQLEKKALHGEKPLGTLLRAYRQREHLTQVELAKATGFTQGQISKLENGEMTDLHAVNTYLAHFGRQLETEYKMHKLAS